MKVFTLSGLLLLSIVFVSCKKDRPESACTVSRSTLAGNYLVTAISYKASPSLPEQDFLLYMPDCSKDNLLQLNADGTYNYLEGANVCDPSDAGSGVWSVAGDRVISDGTLNGTVQRYDCKALVYYLEDVLAEGDRMTFTITRQ
ncbi:MAG: hypothetical protein EOO06_19105 [Chitinophagaceae bacterium]|nr:MAG: hypothetical protein EOO06_19105 [Chitinophagaceae bacterium]